MRVVETKKTTKNVKHSKIISIIAGAIAGLINGIEWAVYTLNVKR